jgi:AcrR family transcriptional regulator
MKAAATREGSDTRTKILEATFKCIYEQGVLDVSLRSIAREVGVNQASIYYHFKNKEDLLIEFIHWLFKEIIDSLEIIETNPGIPRRRMDDLSNAAKKFIRSRKELFVVFIDCWTLSIRNKAMQKIFSDLFMENRRVLRELMDQIKARGYGRGIDPDFFAISVMSYMSGLALITHMVKRPIESEKHLDEWSKILKNALLTK